MVKLVDSFLFSILVLGCFTDKRNKLWRRRSSHLYMIEVKLPLKTNKGDNFVVVQRLLNVLPKQDCFSPRNIVTSRSQLHNKLLSTTSEKLVYHYLKHDSSVISNIQNFNPNDRVKEVNFLQTVLR